MKQNLIERGDTVFASQTGKQNEIVSQSLIFKTLA